MRCSQMKGLLLVIALFFYVSVDGQIIRTLAGDGVGASTSGDGDLGPCVSARFLVPNGIAVDWKGNIYLSDAGKNVIRKIRPDGLITTYAGTGSGGYSGDGGPAINAKLQSPAGLVCDGIGNLYIADAANKIVRKVDTFGFISTIAGDPPPAPATVSSVGGPATTIRLGAVSGLAFDAAGNLYIANGNDRVWKLDPTGTTISLFAGGGGIGFSGNGGQATAAFMEGVSDVFVDAAGIVYISEQANNIVRKVSTTGIITPFAGQGPTLGGSSGDTNPATAAKLNSPGCMKKDAAGNFYICDIGNNKIRKVTPAGIINSYTGINNTAMLANYTGDGAVIGSTTRFFGENGICFDSAGHMFIADHGPGNVPLTGGAGRRIRQIFNVDTFRITVSPNDTICSSDTVNFTAVTTTGYYSFEYRWKVNGVAAGTNSRTFHPVSINNNDRVSCTIIDTANGGMLLAKSDTITMTVNPVVVPTISILTASDTVCIGATANYTASITNGGTTPAIQWKVSGATVATGSSYSYVPSNGDTVTAILTSNAVCAMPNPVRASRIMRVVPLPNAGTVSGPTFVCTTNTISLTISGSTGGSWSVSNSSATVSSGGVVTGLSAGTDTISYTVTTATCGSATTTHIVTVGNTPSAGTIVGATFVCPSATISLTDASAGGTWSATNGRATITSIGLVTGVTSGLDTIRYTVTNSCGTAVASSVITIGVSPLHAAGSITGPSAVCLGSSVTLSDTATTGNWMSRNTGIATINAAGVITTVAPGVDTIYYIFSNSCGADTAAHIITVDPVLSAGAITGLTTVCPGYSISLSNTVAGGTWSVSNAHASITSAGVVSGVTTGQDTVYYTVSNSCNTAIASSVITIGVSSLHDAGTITGPGSVCVGSAITLSDTATGGYWLSGNPAVATIDAAGIVTPVSGGTDTVYYIVTSGCNPDTASHIVVVIPVLSAGTISGLSTVCSGLPVTLTTSGSSGGLWSSSNTAIATVDGTGYVNTLMPGSIVLSYVVGNTCGSDTATLSLTVAPLPFADTITGALLLCVGAPVTLTDTASGGIWSSSAPLIATVNTSGIVTGLSAGGANISYTVTNSCGTDIAVHHVTVNPFPILNSSLTPPSVCSGTLFNYTPSSTTVGASFNWVRSAVPGILNPTAGSSGDPNEILINTTALPVNVIYAFAVSAGGCSTVQNVTVVVKPIPTLSSSDTVVTCAGRTFVYVPASATPGTTYTWVRPAVAGVSPASGSGIGNVVETYTTSGTSSVNAVINYTLTAAGCSAPQNVYLVIQPQGPPPPVITTKSPSWLCTGTMFQNFGTSSVPDTTVTYDWFAQGATVWAQGAGHQYSLVSFPAPGTATIYLATSNVGYSCRSLDSFVVFVDNNTNETISVDYFGGVFIAQPGMSTYQWGYDDAVTLDSTILVGETGSNYINGSPDFAGKYYWVMTEHLFCKQKTYYTIPTGVINASIGGVRQVSISPNPASTTFTVNIVSDFTEPGTISITNMIGSKVMEMPCSTNNKTNIFLEQPAGIYFVTVTTPHGAHTEKVMITR
ncbi:hypothetical protein CJD36_019575 [Flavipsychrobacter stenotrophus]|uniref:Secretion system C-terminal sorting domain-containing protein n=1 Tax=Flavipsychrobacter stenotrophus TaxID=2077091 RepID=A0A2S7SRS5_9BACT|nr:T9SS type A sorting domain-containing protein [Flavipsychrobacter stenotrophus]PQJ09444.1 hypothetical protein CJD36_019575 [Flavipsychrobacter stenotrophus]